MMSSSEMHDLVHSGSTADSVTTTKKIEIPEGIPEPDMRCECDCHNISVISELCDWLSYKKNIHIKCLECKCHG